MKKSDIAGITYDWTKYPHTIAKDGLPIIDGTYFLKRMGDSLEITLPRGWQVDENTLKHMSRNTADIIINYPKCQHEFVDVGFAHSKIVCKHCDMEKP